MPVIISTTQHTTQKVRSQANQPNRKEIKISSLEQFAFFTPTSRLTKPTIRSKSVYLCGHNEHYLLQLNLNWELASVSLIIPLLNPVNRTQRSKGLPEDLTWLKVFTLDGYTLVVIDVILSTVLGLVDVRESWVKLGSLELEGFDVKWARHALQ